MPREQKKSKQQYMRARIAAVAARIMAEDGIEDFAMAKRKAARQLGASDTQSLPNNDEIETELRLYQSLYQGDSCFLPVFYACPNIAAASQCVPHGEFQTTRFRRIQNTGCSGGRLPTVSSRAITMASPARATWARAHKVT